MKTRISDGVAAIGLALLVALPRLTALNQYIIVDEADRWRWAKDFVTALSRGDLAGLRVGDGYPGIVPVWAESLWILLEAGRRSLLAGRWIGDEGLYLLMHEWERPAFLFQQRLPIVLLNTLLALAIIWAVWRLFGRRVALVGGVLLALDPFYLSDSRVNRAEAVITGLMTLSVLALIFYYRRRRFRYVIFSGILGGLSFLTKIQALALLPAVALIGLLIYSRREGEAGSKRTSSYPLLPTSYSLLPTPYSLLPTPYSLLLIVKFGLGWAAAAGLTWLILWPSMWVIPLETLNLVYDYTTHKVGAEGVNLFFMGQTYADADPGFIFYPFTLLMRLTPLALLGLIAAGVRFSLRHKKTWSPAGFIQDFRRRGDRPVAPTGNTKNFGHTPLANDPFTAGGSFILVCYILGYALAMTLGSHKQDRYLMPIFPSLDLLAGMGLLYLGGIGSRKYEVGSRQDGVGSRLPLWGFGLVLSLQLITVLPHHPYYYSYFNPLMGGGQTAVRTMRVGWGEGMDQVGAYLAAKPNSDNLTVSTRFTHNMPDFKGNLISLGLNGRWTQADYLVLYIQQVQRRQEPSPEFIDYFLARSPEKVITIGGIDYAWIYPRPFTTPANPEVSVIPNQAALLGYSWEANEPAHQSSAFIRLVWENQGLKADRQLVARLVGQTAQTDWAACQPDPAFVTQARTPQAYVESRCAPGLANLPPGLYTVEFGLTSANAAEAELFTFPEGWQAATLAPAGQVKDTPSKERLEAIAAQALPPDALRLDRLYEGRIRLAAYQLEPPVPPPGSPVKLTLYWQPVKEVLEPLRLIVQLADSRNLSLGRTEADLPANQWRLGQVVATEHRFSLAADLDAPLAAQLEVTLQNEAEVRLRATTQAGEELAAGAARFTIAPAQPPPLPEGTPVEAIWQNGLALKGCRLSPQPARPGEPLSVSLFWQTDRPIAENYVIFVHLLDETGQIRAQNDDLPRAGAYPTPWWQPGETIQDVHGLLLPPDLPPATYQLAVGLYRREDGARLPLAGGKGDSATITAVEVR